MKRKAEDINISSPEKKSKQLLLPAAAEKKTELLPAGEAASPMVPGDFRTMAFEIQMRFREAYERKEYLLFVHSKDQKTRCFLVPMTGALPSANITLLTSVGHLNSEDVGEDGEEQLTQAYRNLETAVFKFNRAVELCTGQIEPQQVVKAVFSFSVL